MQSINEDTFKLYNNNYNICYCVFDDKSMLSLLNLSLSPNPESKTKYNICKKKYELCYFKKGLFCFILGLTNNKKKALNSYNLYADKLMSGVELSELCNVHNSKEYMPQYIIQDSIIEKLMGV